VSRARATLRSAEFGFFGVWVYTRIQTPRFSGQPCKAGDFVLDRTCSRPARTNCANVGTTLPQTSRFGFAPRPRQTNECRVSWVSNEKGSVATPEETDKILRGGTPRPNTASGPSAQTYSALRGWRPSPAASLTP